MHPIALSFLLGLTAAGANVFGGAVIVQKNWERRYLRYFVALGSGFMLATASLHAFGIGLASLVRPVRLPVLRWAGAAIAVAGVCLWVF